MDDLLKTTEEQEKNHLEIRKAFIKEALELAASPNRKVVLFSTDEIVFKAEEIRKNASADNNSNNVKPN